MVRYVPSRRLIVSVCVCAFTAVALIIGASGCGKPQNETPATETDIQTTQPPVVAAPSPDSTEPSEPLPDSESVPVSEPAGNATGWYRFRGPNGLGVALGNGYPTAWKGETGENIIWKTPVEMIGSSSPVIVHGRMILTSATETEHHVYCFDAATGGQLWKTNLPCSPKQANLKVWDKYTHAAATPATDGERIAVIFANADLACLDLNGKILWSRYLGPIQNTYGHAASLDIFKNRLIIQFDQKKKDDAFQSKLLALDIETGDLVWETTRPVFDSWTSPIIFRAADKDQIITVATPFVMSHDADNGSELWRAECINKKAEVAPSATFADGLVFVAMESSNITAIRPDGTGDVTGTHIVWNKDIGDLPSVCSPVSNGELLFIVNAAGIMSCWDAKTGDELWNEDLGVSVVASPTLAGSYVYVIGEEGEGVILDASRTFNVIARSPVGDFCMATPAFVDGRIYVRTETSVMCIGSR